VNLGWASLRSNRPTLADLNIVKWSLYMQDDVINTAEEFAEQHNFHFEVHRVPKNELREGNKGIPQNWLPFEKQPGVYVFSNEKEDEVIYIGAAGWKEERKSDVGSRLAAHWDKPHWSEATDITIFAWDSKDDNIRSLEKHLNDTYNPKYKQRS